MLKQPYDMILDHSLSHGPTFFHLARQTMYQKVNIIYILNNLLLTTSQIQTISTINMNDIIITPNDNRYSFHSNFFLIKQTCYLGFKTLIIDYNYLQCSKTLSKGIITLIICTFFYHFFLRNMQLSLCMCFKFSLCNMSTFFNNVPIEPQKPISLGHECNAI